MAWESTQILQRPNAGFPVLERGVKGEAPSADRRRERRRRVYKGATIKFNGGFCALQCIVVDLSPSGARLSFGDTLGIPATFEIRIFGEEKWRRATLRWRKSESLGIAFSAAA